MSALPASLVQQVARQVGAGRSRNHRRLRAAGRDHRRRPTCLAEAGLWADSDALLKANLAKSQLAVLPDEPAGRQRAQARPHRTRRCAGTPRPSHTSEGPATRLQWGARYITALVDLAPGTRRASSRSPRSCSPRPRSTRAPSTGAARRSLQRAVPELVAWNGAAGTPRRCAGCRPGATACAPRSTAPRASATPARRCSSPRQTGVLTAAGQPPDRAVAWGRFGRWRFHRCRVLFSMNR